MRSHLRPFPFQMLPNTGNLPAIEPHEVSCEEIIGKKRSQVRWRRTPHTALRDETVDRICVSCIPIIGAFKATISDRADFRRSLATQRRGLPESPPSGRIRTEIMVSFKSAWTLSVGRHCRSDQNLVEMRYRTPRDHSVDHALARHD